MKKNLLQILAFVVLGAILFLLAELSIGEDQKPLVAMDLTARVDKIFQQSCAITGCHQGAFPKKKLNLESGKFFKALVDQPSLQADNCKLVDSEHPEKSYLLIKVKGDSGLVEARMPLDAPSLKSEEIKAIEDWVHSLKKVQEKKKNGLPGTVGKKS